MEIDTQTNTALSRPRRKVARPGGLLDSAIGGSGARGFSGSRPGVRCVARRGGVSKETAYLYFPNKEALFKAAIHEVGVTRIAMGEREVEEWRGSSEELLRQVLGHWAQVIRSRQGGLLKLIVAEARNFPDLAAWYHTEAGEGGHRLLMAVLRRGVERGEFRPFDVEAMADVIACPMAFRAIWQHSLGCYEALPVSDERFYENSFDMMVAGLRAPSAAAPKD